MANTFTHLTGSLYITGSVTASLGYAGGDGFVTGSSQIDHDLTTNYVANEHIDHSSVTITGTGALTGGGDLTTSRTITLDGASTAFSSSVKTILNNEGVNSGSAGATDFDITDGTTTRTIDLGETITLVSNNHINASILGAGGAIPQNNFTFEIASGSNIVTSSGQIDFDSLNNLPTGLVSQSAQVNADTITNFDSNVLAYINSIEVASGSVASSYNDLTDVPVGLVSQSAQINANTVTNFDTNVKDKLNADAVVSGSTTQVRTFLNVADGATNYGDSEVKAKLNSEYVVSGSASQVKTFLDIQESDISDLSHFTVSDLPTGTVSQSAQISGLGFVDKTGTPANNQIAIFTDSNTIEGDSGFTFDGTTFTIPGFNDVSASLASAVAGGDNLGNHTATQDLDMGTNAITNVGNVDGVDVSTLNTNFTTLQGKTLISSSAQVDHDSTLNFAANEHFTQASITTVGTVTAGNVNAILPVGLVSQSAQVDAFGFAKLAGDGLISQSAQVNANSIVNFDSNVKSKMNTDVVVSGSATQVRTYLNVADGATNYGDSNVKTKLDTETVVSGSATQVKSFLNIQESDVSGLDYFQISDLPTGTMSGSAQTVANLVDETTNFGTGFVTASALLINGDIDATGDITAYHSSDRRLKDNITRIDNSIYKIKQLGGYEFDWNANSTFEGHDIGVIAQEVESVLPELVTTRVDTGYKAVRYDKLVALLIEAVKDLQSQVDELKASI